MEAFAEEELPIAYECHIPDDATSNDNSGAYTTDSSPAVEDEADRIIREEGDAEFKQLISPHGLSLSAEERKKRHRALRAKQLAQEREREAEKDPVKERKEQHAALLRKQREKDRAREAAQETQVLLAEPSAEAAIVQPLETEAPQSATTLEAHIETPTPPTVTKTPRETPPQLLDPSLASRYIEIIPEALKPGTVVEGYTVKEVIAAGGCGTVYKVEKDEKTYALKLFHKKRAKSEATAFDKLREINCTKIVHYEEVLSDEEGASGVVMEHIDGPSLEERLKDDTLSFKEVITIGKALASALNYLHHPSKKIAHGDIKPSNIRFRKDGTPVLVDFGLAESEEGGVAVTDVTRQPFRATPRFETTEEAEGLVTAPTPEADVAKLAKTLYIALQGKPPLDATDKGKYDKDITQATLTEAFLGYVSEKLAYQAKIRAEKRCSAEELYGAFSDIGNDFWKYIRNVEKEGKGEEHWKQMLKRLTKDETELATYFFNLDPENFLFQTMDSYKFGLNRGRVRVRCGEEAIEALLSVLDKSKVRKRGLELIRETFANTRECAREAVQAYKYVDEIDYKGIEPALPAARIARAAGKYLGVEGKQQRELEDLVELAKIHDDSSPLTPETLYQFLKENEKKLDRNIGMMSDREIKNLRNAWKEAKEWAYQAAYGESTLKKIAHGAVRVIRNGLMCYGGGHALETALSAPSSAGDLGVVMGGVAAMLTVVAVTTSELSKEKGEKERQRVNTFMNQYSIKRLQEALPRTGSSDYQVLIGRVPIDRIQNLTLTDPKTKIWRAQIYKD